MLYVLEDKTCCDVLINVVVKPVLYFVHLLMLCCILTAAESTLGGIVLHIVTSIVVYSLRSVLHFDLVIVNLYRGESDVLVVDTPKL